MVTVSIVASGSRGDVQPYVALGKGLRRAGFDVRLLSSDDFGGLADEAGLAFASIGESVEALLQNEEWRKTTESGNFLTILGRMRAEMKRSAASTAHRLADLLADSDLVLAGMAGMYGAFAIAEQMGIPLIQAYVVPLTPTGEHPSPLAPGLPLGRTLNRASFHLTRQIFWQGLKVADQTVRRQLGLTAAPFWGPYRRLRRDSVPALYGYSRHVLPQPRNWPAEHHVTGYWFLEAAEEWTPPADLIAFLDAGPPPVYIGFGSMGGRDPEGAGEIALEALARSGQRGVLSAGWGGLHASDLPESVYAVSSIPHTWLFPRMAAVVHHGGAGTTAACLRAGVPSVAVPFFGDQPFWGRRLAHLGVGPQPIPRKRLSAERLGAAISECVSSDAMRRQARMLGEEIRSEDGIGRAVALIERYVDGVRSVGRATPVA